MVEQLLLAFIGGGVIVIVRQLNSVIGYLSQINHRVHQGER
jgi:hypothetical protein